MIIIMSLDGFEIIHRFQNGLALVAALQFPLDGDEPIVAQVSEGAEHLFKVHVAGADGHLFSQLVGICGGQAVLGMHVPHVLAEGIQGIHRVPIAVEDHVGGIQVDENVIQPDIFDQS